MTLPPSSGAAPTQPFPGESRFRQLKTLKTCVAHESRLIYIFSQQRGRLGVENLFVNSLSAVFAKQGIRLL